MTSSSSSGDGGGALFYRNRKALPEMDAWLEERAADAEALWDRSAEMVGLTEGRGREDGHA